MAARHVHGCLLFSNTLRLCARAAQSSRWYPFSFLPERGTSTAPQSTGIPTSAEGEPTTATSGSPQRTSAVRGGVAARKWTRESRRTGAIALKLGMTQLWSSGGNRIAVTLLQIVDNQVVYVRTKRKEGYYALQVGAVNHPKKHRVSGPLRGHFAKAGTPLKRKLWEFRVTRRALLPVGTPITAAHFTVGQYVDVCATTIGKGFQGVMKRHGMKGQPASHGTSKTHRKMGATGGGGDPGRIWPGKRMPGRMGGVRRTVQNLKVLRINHAFDVLYVTGAVPGHKMQYVRVTDARRSPHTVPPPFPTYVPGQHEPLLEETFAEGIHLPFSPSLDLSSERQLKGRR